MIYLYDTILYKPLLNALVFLYNTVAFHDLGLAIIFLTILIRLILFPIFHKSAKHQIVMQRLQPELKKIQDIHRDDKTKQTRAMMDLYKEHNVSPFSGFLLLLVQFPILIALYQIFRDSLNPTFLNSLYGFVAAPPSLNTSLFGLINLGGKSILMVCLAALAQYFQGKLSLPKAQPGQTPTPAEKMGRQMVFMGPAITLLIFYSLPAAISLYWLVASLFSILQQIIVNKHMAYGQLGNHNQKNN